MVIVDVPVLIVGGGPVGLMCAILLARLGIRSRIVERRSGPQRAPAAHVVNARTFEIFRATGIDMEAITAVCKDPRDAGRVFWVTTLAGEVLGSLPFERQGADVLALTPTPLRNLSQHLLEPILIDALRRLPETEILYGQQWECAEQESNGVTSRVHDLARDATVEVRSRWLIAADGAGSRVRKSVGIEPIGPSRLQDFVMIHFEANLRGLVGDRPGVIYWTTDPDATGTMVAHDIDSTWVYMHPWDPEHEAAADYTREVCGGIVCRALGTDAIPFSIRTISPWTMTAQVAERYRAGRTFLLGDAAHRFPPTGGLGLNTGVQDAHNLAWKLAAVEADWAPEALLDTYEAERRPVALRNAEVSAQNAMRIFEVFQALDLPGDKAGIRERYARALADPAARPAIRKAIEAQAEHFDMLGLQLGFSYEEGAIVSDGSAKVEPANPVREYVPSARPGARVPHAWVERNGVRCSTLDLFPSDRFTLVTGVAGTRWARALRAIDVPHCSLAIGRDLQDPNGAWSNLLSIGPAGALLVRPDQHVAWRSRGEADDPAGVLRQAFARILGA